MNDVETEAAERILNWVFSWLEVILKPAASVCPPPPYDLAKVRAIGSLLCFDDLQDTLTSYYFFMARTAKFSSPSSADKKARMVPISLILLAFLGST